MKIGKAVDKTAIFDKSRKLDRIQRMNLENLGIKVVEEYTYLGIKMNHDYNVMIHKLKTEIVKKRV